MQGLQWGDIIGTWRGVADSRDGDSRVFTFNSNGTFTCLNTLINQTISGIYYLSAPNATGMSNLFLKADNAAANSFSLAT